MDDLEFRRDLYRGTARDYDRFRPPYPQSLIDDLAARTGADGVGRLLDLGCGPGVISFALHARFGEVWAVDLEPDMVGFVRQKAEAAGIGNIHAQAAAAEDLPAPERSFDLIALGNAFHRMPRQTVAAHAFRWLRPGRHLALLWGGDPWGTEAPWQRAAVAARDRWMARVGPRVPAGYARDREERPDQVILREAGFQPVGTFEFSVVHEWTPETVIGYMYSTSVLSRVALGGLAPEFEADVRHELLTCEPSGRLPKTMEFAYVLARRPG